MMQPCDHSPAVSIVIPVFMSGGILNELFSRLRNVLNSIGTDWEIIMVDDGSGDDTYEVMRSLRATERRVKIMRLAKNYGQHTATLCGLRRANGAYIITLDDDLQHPPEEIPRLLEKLREGFDVVIGKYAEKMHGRARNLSSCIIDWTSTVLLGKPRGLYWSSFRGLSKRAAGAVTQFKGTNLFLTALILRSVPLSSIANIEVKHNIRCKGTSGYTLPKLVKLFFSLLMMQTNFRFENLVLCGTALVGLALIGGLAMRPAWPVGAVALISILFATLLLSGIFILAWGVVGYARGKEACSPENADSDMIAEQEG